MNLVNIDSKSIFGLVLRTSNATELDPKTAQIAQFVQEVDREVKINYREGRRAYSVYHNYESDMSGEFDILMGSDEIEYSTQPLRTVTIEAGHYLEFEAEGEMPEMVIELWMQIWAYFSSDTCKYKRRYTTDFEYYKTANQVSVFIAVSY
jgi:predicted transcriptional regulator YdeE